MVRGRWWHLSICRKCSRVEEKVEGRVRSFIGEGAIQAYHLGDHIEHFCFHFRGFDL